jgi:hypothetical protein
MLTTRRGIEGASGELTVRVLGLLAPLAGAQPLGQRVGFGRKLEELAPNSRAVALAPLDKLHLNRLIQVTQLARSLRDLH